MDQVFAGGYQPSALFVLGLPTGGGKTSLTIHLACASVRVEKPIIVVQAETSLMLLTQRMLANLTDIHINRIEQVPHTLWAEILEKRDFGVLYRDGFMDEEESMIMEAAYLSMDKHIYLHKPGTGVPDIEEFVIRHGMATGYAPDVLYDHIGYSIGGQSAAFYLKEEADRLYAVSERNGNCIVTWSQVDDSTGKSLATRNTPGSDPQFKYSNGIKNGAFQAIFGCRHNGKDADGNYIPWVIKHNVTCLHRVKNRGRHGTGSYWVGYNPDTYKYYEFKKPDLIGWVERAKEDAREPELEKRDERPARRGAGNKVLSSVQGELLPLHGDESTG